MSLPERVLVANRGEIALRVMATCRRLGIRTVAVYSDADRTAPFVRFADESVRIGPAPASESYLNAEAIVAAALETGTEAVHPGYGFLSERADFAQAVIDAGLRWIGPPPAAIAALGDKVSARRLARAADVPVAEGVEDDLGDAELAAEIARIGLPVMIKAAAGGGGRGMRLIAKEGDAPDGLEAAVASARREATAAFGEGRLLVERALSSGRHVEVQVMFDQHGNGVHLGERDCSVQRRRQKVIEESPSPAVDEGRRTRLGEAALSVCRAAGYENAGTVEFLLMPEGEFVFLEVNTRLQVEHPVTELVTGLDLVELQLRVAADEPLGIAQEDVSWSGHAIELRLYAEDPSRGYVPSTGRLERFQPHDARARYDLGTEVGEVVTAHYDPMLAKTIVHGSDRAEAIRLSRAALDGWAIAGVTTNLGQLSDILASDDFRAGEIDIAWLDRTELTSAPAPRAALAVGAISEAEAGAWRSSGELARSYLLHGRPRQVVLRRGLDSYELSVDGDQATAVAITPGWSAEIADWGVLVAGDEHRWALLRPTRPRRGRTRSRAVGGNVVRAPMPGTMIAILVSEGDEVEAGQTLAVMEAMKMEHLLTAPNAGVVSAIHVQAGDSVDEEALLIELGATT